MADFFTIIVLKNRVLKPPGGSSSNIFGSPNEVSVSLKPHRMASNIFGGGEEPQTFPKRTNPPGEMQPVPEDIMDGLALPFLVTCGKDSGIFEDHKPNPSHQLANPPGGKTSDIFGSAQPSCTVKAHPNKPK
ncbi:hypothetical protein JD844_019747, partial [Phrynosoma platyrhinos]